MRTQAYLIVSLLAVGALEGQVQRAAFVHPLRTIDSVPAPESVAVGPDGAWYVSSFGKFDVKGDGAILRIDPDKGSRETFTSGLDDPCGLIFVGATLWVADRQGVYRARKGRAELVYPQASFPRPLHFLNDLAADSNGRLYVSDTGDSTRAGHGAVFVLSTGEKPAVLPGSDTVQAQSSANGLWIGDGDTVYAVGYRTGWLSRTDGRGAWRNLVRGLGSPDGIAAAAGNAFYITDNVGGDLLLVPRAGDRKTVMLARGLKSPADLVVDRARGLLIVPENSGNRLSIYRVEGLAGAL